MSTVTHGDQVYYSLFSVTHGKQVILQHMVGSQVRTHSNCQQIRHCHRYYAERIQFLAQEAAPKCLPRNNNINHTTNCRRSIIGF